MESSHHCNAHKAWWLFSFFAIPATANLFDFHVLFPLFSAFIFLALLSWAFAPAGIAWKNGRNSRGRIPIPGLKGLPFFGSLFSLSLCLPHRYLASMAKRRCNTELMAFSLGETPHVVSSHPVISREILTSPHFADRPVKQSARSLMFSRAIGFAPNGTYWRFLRGLVSSRLFCPRCISAHEAGRQTDCDVMLRNIAHEQKQNGYVSLRKHLQFAALNNIMGSVFGKRYDFECDREELEELRQMVREGFDLLGAFNMCDYLPWISFFYDPFRIVERCSKLVPRVRQFVKRIINEHRHSESRKTCDNSDFVDVLLSLDGDEKLQEDDIIAILWEMIFRGTDTTALLTEWVMAELVLNSEVQSKLQVEMESVVGDRAITDADVARLPYLQAVVKEALRVHPPGPLLSWARLSTSDVQLSNGMLVPANTIAMVNMWAITHDASVWEDANVFKPERFLDADVDIRGGDLRLAPFGAGRRVCPGKTLGLAMVTLWVAKLVNRFKWIQDMVNPVDLTEVMNLSCEMKKPLCAVVERRKD